MSETMKAVVLTRFGGPDAFSAVTSRPVGRRAAGWRSRLRHGPEEAFDAVPPLLAAADGHLRHRLVPTMDERDTFLLEVAWRDPEAHVTGFEPSEARPLHGGAGAAASRTAGRDPRPARSRAMTVRTQLLEVE